MNVSHEEKTSHVVLELKSGASAQIWGLRTLCKSNVLKVNYRGKSAYVQYRLFVSKKADAREYLAGQGLVITSTPDWNEILKGVDEIVRFERSPILEQPGWTTPYFAQPNGKAYAPKGEPKPIIMFKRSVEVANCKGTLAGWRNAIGEPLTGQTIPMLAVLAAFAAPLLRFTQDDLNFGFEFSGGPETGKTTCLQIMASTTGSPAGISDFNATMTGLEDKFSAYNDSPFPVDEANLAEHGDGRFMKDFAFRMANGTDKVTRYQPVRARHRFVFATTANEPFYSSLANYHTDTAGAALQRLIPIKISADSALGVFDFLPDGFTTSGALATHLTEAMRRQYGSPMRKFLQCLVDARAHCDERIRNEVHLKIKAFEAATGVAATDRGRTRASTYLGILYAAGCFAKLHHIVPSSWNCLEACLAAYRNYQAQLPSHTPLATRLLTIAKRAETLDLRTGELPNLNRARIDQHGSFLRIGVAQRIELLFTESIKQSHFPDWGKISATREFEAINLRDADHATKQRKIRRGGGLERYFCFVLPTELASCL